jgi:hypothetical protein
LEIALAIFLVLLLVAAAGAARFYLAARRKKRARPRMREIDLFGGQD